MAAKNGGSIMHRVARRTIEASMYPGTAGGDRGRPVAESRIDVTGAVSRGPVLGGRGRRASGRPRRASADTVRKRRRAIVAGILIPIFAILASCGGAEEREAEYLERGKALFEKRDYVKARLEFENALQINPASVGAQYYLGLTNERQGDWQRAFINFRKVTEQQPDHVDAHLKLGHFHLLAGDFQKAREEAEIVTGLDPGNPGLFVLRAAIHLRSDELDEAKGNAEAALALAPGDVDAASVLARTYQRVGEVALAVSIIDESLGLNPENIPLRLLKIRLYLDDNQFDQTEGLFRELFELDPENYGYRAALARLYAIRARWADAERLLRETIAAGIGGSQPKLHLVDLLERRDGFEAAEQELVRLIGAEPDTYAFAFRLASLYAKNGLVARAKAVLQDVIDRDVKGPNGLSARAALAELSLAAGDKASAGQLIAEVLKEDPVNRDALLLRARLALEKEEYEGAIGDLRTVLRHSPDSKPALRMLVQAQLGRGDVGLAIDTLNRLIDLDPSDNESRLRLAALLMRSGNRDTVLKLVDQVLETEPESALALRVKAEILIAERRWLDAETTVDRLLALPEQKVTGHILAGGLYQSQARHDEAIAAFEQALALEPDSRPASVGIVRAYMAQQRPDAALRFLDGMIARGFERAWNHNLRGEVLAMQRRTEEAEACFRRAAALRSDWPTPYLNLGRLFLLEDRIEGAVGVYTSALEVLPDNQQILFALGRAQERAQQFEAAIGTYETVLEKFPHLDAAANNLAALIADFRRDPESLKRALELAKAFEASDNALFLDTLGWVYYRMGDPNQARIYLERAVSLRPDVPQLQYHLGMVLHAMGLSDRARTALEKAVGDDGGYPGIEEARATLRKL